MIIGHVGVAFAVRRGVPAMPFGWLLTASFAPDIWRVVLSALGYTWWPSNMYSHALPWSFILAAVLGSVAWLVLRNGVVAIGLCLIVLSHVGLDMISGWKPLWIGGPSGLDFLHFEQAEFAIEAIIAFVGWRSLACAEVPRWLTRWPVLVALLLLEASYLKTYYDARPEATRCVSYPVSPCWTSY